MRASVIVFAMVLPLIAVGCSDVPAHSLGPDFGEAYYTNKTVQVIDPMPEHADEGAPELNGNRAALAIRRYEENRVLQPRASRTTSVLSGGGAGGGGNQ